MIRAARRVSGAFMAHPVRANAVFAVSSFAYLASAHAVGII